MILRSASEDNESDDESVVPTHRSQRMSQRSPRKNGRSKIDMTPPDKKLKVAEKKVLRFTENGKVSFFSKFIFTDSEMKISVIVFCTDFFHVKNTDRKILLYLIVFKIAMFDISIFTFRITYIVLYNTVNNSLNYHIPYSTVNSSLNHYIPYSTVNR